ncbi:MAG: DUF2169 domain-containing protein [Deltaproteobacteria bacterium]|jgi:hypothetical protein|nr:DUF2169 domain-containing protein [Deltaproteobacteria bacterium]MBW2537906.1 DUF2169 domain-containing protein [Deltaproteobacteria bacterium]
MEVASFCPLPVGVLSWNAPQPVTTVIVKATFAMERDGVAVLADQQEPLCLDWSLVGGTGELYCASDFVPRKSGVDLLLVGHARAREPNTVLPFALSVGDRRLTWIAVSRTPAAAVPLLQSRVRVRDPGAAGRVAPARHRARGGWQSRTIVGDFDYSLFNAAEPGNRLAGLSPGTSLVLEGLLAGAAQRRIELAGLAPFVFQVPGSDPASLRMGQRVQLSCDTLWIDVDREIFTLCWRGTADRTIASTARPLLAVGMGPVDDLPSWEATAAGLDDAHWYEAVGEADLTPELPVELGGDSEADGPPTGRLPSWPSGGRPSEGRGHGPARYSADSEEGTQVLPDPAPSSPPPPAAAEREDVFGTSTSTSWPRQEVLDAVRAHEQGKQLAADDDDERTARVGERLPAGIRALLDDEETDDGIATTVKGEAETEELHAAAMAGRAGALPDRGGDSSPARRGAFDADEPTGQLPAAPLGPDEDDVTLAVGVSSPSAAASPASSCSAGQPSPRSSTGRIGPGRGAAVSKRQDDEDTATGVEIDSMRRAPLPFSGSGSSPPPSAAAHPGTAQSFGGHTRTVQLVPAGPALPFARPPSRPPEPSRPSRPLSGVGDESVPPPRAPLPPPRPPEPRSAAELQALRADEVKDRTPKSAAPASPELPLETYARIKAQLWNRPAELAAILEAHDLDQTQWRAIEVRQSLAIAQDASRGSGQLAVEIRKAIAAARRQLAASSPKETELDLEDYAALRVAIDDADDPRSVLDEHGLTEAEWERHQRSWSHRAMADGRVAAELRRRMAEARSKAQDHDG